MKKLSTLIAIILIATIGGVYATWNYAGTTTNIGVQENKTITLEDAVLDGAAGTFTLSHNINTIVITPVDQETKEAQVFATYTSGNAPVFTLTFTPAPNAGSIADYALTSYVYFGTENDYKWDWDKNPETESTSLFKFPNASKAEPYVINATNETGGDYTWVEEDGKFTCTITFAKITEIIDFAQVLKLPEIDDYNALVSAFGTRHTIALHMHLSNIAPNA